ncbi:unnamed protein product [Brassicogethes aeneus]|uniref:MICOS complex subunit n=1 Tax=Brassicogethes aeneus TaxID=1431903 RepID=A0A9P0B5N3_BRAAE|nr:unnamed protein product [Brassicogethes aeneus]
MFAGKVLRRVLIPSATAVAVKKEQDSTSEAPSYICKPSKLPIYVPEPEVKRVETQQTDEASGAIEEVVRTTRQTLQKVSMEISAYERVGMNYFEQSKENLDWLVDYLRKEDNSMPRAGAIAIGALAGLIMGLRGRFFKRTLYMTAGGLGMAAVCYPKEAAEYSQVGLVEARKYITIGYNFILGDKEKTEEKVEVSKSGDKK